MIGDEGGYLLALTGDTAELSSLSLDTPTAKILGADPGPLTAKRLAAIMVNRQATGLVQQIQDPKPSKERDDKLAAMWRVLIPQSHRQSLTSGKLKRLVIVPDGQLALLPFETLVVQPGAAPRYLLDIGPPILYGPSATVLHNLVGRPAATAATEREPVLTVGNPSYQPAESSTAAPPTATLDQLSTRSRYCVLGGKLAALPYSGWESQWVAEVFNSQGVKARRLEGSQATKANVSSQIEGRRLVHLACHGLVDQAYGNFFGALALAPGRQVDDLVDDGFLILAEIYRLNLNRCELAILSACETNFGPQQRGEGVWAISRGFLVAGSRRVVASNWLVDDEAAASLVSYFCGGIARAEKSAVPPDYAGSLQKAKQWVRQQEKWATPYYWGTFVLVGPN